MVENDMMAEGRHQQERNPKGRFFQIRNILNIIFMVGASAGVILYFYAGHTVGTIVILAAMVFKIIECSLRFFH
jgi:hypothetical protein